jgi:hypothetical protein
VAEGVGPKFKPQYHKKKKPSIDYLITCFSLLGPICGMDIKENTNIAFFLTAQSRAQLVLICGASIQ